MCLYLVADTDCEHRLCHLCQLCVRILVPENRFTCTDMVTGKDSWSVIKFLLMRS